MEHTATPSAFTTGPWHVDPYGAHDTGNMLVKQVHGSIVCELDPLPEAPANARLIAAAPELLTCARYLLRLCDSRLPDLIEEDEPEEVVELFWLLRLYATGVLAKAGATTAIAIATDH